MKFKYLICMLLLIGCDGARSRPPTSQPAHSSSSMPPLVWDLTAGREPSRVGWPANVTDTIWFIEDPTVVDLTMPLGERHVISFRSAQIRVDDQCLVRGCYFFYEPESLDAAYQHAQNLCKEMEITNTTALDEWYKKRQIDKGDTGGELWVGLDREKGNQQPCTVEVRQAYDPAAPWQVRLGFLFDEIKSTTQPNR